MTSEIFVMTRQWREVHKFSHLSFLWRKTKWTTYLWASPSLPPLDWHFSQLLGKDKQVVTLSFFAQSFSATLIRSFSFSGGLWGATISQECVELRKVSGAIFTAASFKWSEDVHVKPAALKDTRCSDRTSDMHWNPVKVSCKVACFS